MGNATSLRIEARAMNAQPKITKLKAWPHQCDAFAHARQHKTAWLGAMGMGTGKTKVTIDLALNERWKITLIVCPKSVLGVWRRELEKHWPYPNPYGAAAVCVLDQKTGAKKLETLSRFLQYTANGVRQTFVVVNYESAWRGELGKLLLSVVWSSVVADEIHRIKAAGGKSSRWMQLLGARVPRRIGLSGTVMPHSPLDLYGQFRFLAPSIFGTSFARFRAAYAITNPMFPSQVRQWINQDDLRRRFESITFKCRAEDVLQLPEAIYDSRSCILEPKSRRVYDDLKTEFIAEVEAGTVTVGNALTKLLRLQQVTSGFVTGRDDHDERFAQELGTEKRELLYDVLEDINRPAVVFCRFQHDLNVVEQLATELKRNYGELSGRRHDLTPTAEMLPETELMGVQIQSGGVGVDLTRANYAFDYSVGYSLGDYQQSRARLHRPGQLHPCWFYALTADKTVDEDVYKALERREDVVNSILQPLLKVA